MARPPATAPVKKHNKQSPPNLFQWLLIPPWDPRNKNLPGHGQVKPPDIGGGIAGAFKGAFIEPIVGDFKKNRGKVIIGIVAGVVLLGGGFKLINGATGGGITKGALTIAAPEIEAASVVKQGLKQSATRRLHAREPIAPMRYAMRKANP